MSYQCHTTSIGGDTSRSRAQTLHIPPTTSYSSGQPTSHLPTKHASKLVQNRARGSQQPRHSHRVNASSISVSLSALDCSQQTEHDDSFENMVEQSPTPILVDFYAPWCGPCQLMSKIVADISTEMKDDLKVMKINTDSYPKLASKYRIQALPTCLLFRDGKVIDRVDGFMPEPSFGKRIRFYVARLDKKFGRR